MNPTKALLFLLLISCSPLFAQETTTYNYTGAVQTYTVPEGITSVQVEVWGAQGQELTIEDFDGSVGGLGGYAFGELAVTAGEVLYIYVGGTGTDGAGGFNGGGTGGFGIPGDLGGGYAGSGGGASDIRQGGSELENRVIVGGGGGGGGRDYVNGSCLPCGTGGNGGAGGGLSGVDGSDPWYDIGGPYTNPGSGGKGATDIAGGDGGDGPEGEDGNSGTLGIGADGVNGNYSVASGGGGGGYYGGGSGAGAEFGSGVAGGGGAGGSSYIGGVSEGGTASGMREGNGQVVITEICFALTTEVSTTEICEGEPLILFAESISGGEISWSDPDIINGEPFSPSETGTITYIATSDLDSDCPFAVDITVHEAPEVTAISDFESICLGDSITLTGGGADTYVWNYGAENGIGYIPDVDAGEVEFQVIGTESEFGCQDSATVVVTVNALPEVEAMSDSETYCEGDPITLFGVGAETYVWDYAVEDGMAFYQDAGTLVYTVVGTAADGCQNSDSIEIEVLVALEITLSATDELFGDDGSVLLSIDLGLAPYTFDWDNDGVGDDDDDQNLLDIPGGTYTVTMTDANGCSVTQTIMVNSQLSLEEKELNVQVYPNPTTAFLQVEMNGAFLYVLRDMTGKLILQGHDFNSAVLNMSNQAAGMYLLEINQDQQVKQIQVLKN